MERKWFTQEIAIGTVKPPLHPRTIKEAGIESLAASIAATGLRHPVTVDDDHRLIAGQRRLLACKSLGWRTIPATVVDLDNGEAELAGIDENLQREDYIEVERVQAIARRKVLYESIHPETRAGVAGGIARHADSAVAKKSVAESFVTDTAKKSGLSEREVRRQVQIGKNLDPKAAAIVADVPTVADSKAELKALSELTPEKQREVAAKVNAGKAKSVRAAVAEATPKSGQQKKDPRLWQEIEGLYGKALNRTDELNRQFPHGNLHRKLIAETKMCMATLAEWKKASR